MNNKSIILLISVGIILIYILLISFITEPVTNMIGQTQLKGGGMLEIGVGNKVDVSIQRNRWYGTYMGTGSTESLYLFNILKIPTKINGTDYMPLHIILISVLIIINLLAFILEMKGG